MSLYIGIDIGGTKTKSAVLTGFKKHKPKFFIRETPKDLGEFLVMLENLIEESAGGKKINGIGIALPGSVDIKKGILTEAHNLPILNKWNAVKFLKKFSKRVAVDNDSRSFLLAELEWGRAKSSKNTVGITIGTGIGGGLAFEGKIYRGSYDTAGELGKMIIAGENTLEFLGNKSTKLNPRERNKVIGIGVANVANILNPDTIILGGGGISGGYIDLEQVKQQAYSLMPYGSTKRVKIIAAGLGYYASAIGAAFLLK